MRKRVLSSEHAPTSCPHCGYVVDAATSLQGMNRPGPGCVTVCFKCAGVSQYTAAMDLVPFDAAKLDPAAAAMVAKAQREIRGRLPS